MAKTYLMLDTRRALQDGTYPVKICVGYGTNLYLSTDVSVEDWQWDPENRKVEGHREAKALNRTLSAQLARVSARMVLLREQGRLGSVSSRQLRKLLTAPDMDEVPDEDNRKDFYQVADMWIGMKEGGTRTLYKYTVDKVKTYAGGHVFIEDMDRVWLHGFDAFMGGKINARAVHMRNLRAICNFALDEELTTFYPFRKYKIRQEETRKKALTVEQVRAFLHADGLSPWEDEHRDVFMLMIYLRGINTGDLAKLTEGDIVDGRLEYRRSKTGQLYSIRLEPEALEILERRKGKAHLLDCFDRYADHRDYNHHLNDALKRMSGPDGKPIEPDCSSNWARHTWATMAAELDVPDPTISLGMGHRIAGHRTTAVYIKRDQRKVDEANRQVIDYINLPASHDAGRPETQNTR